MVENGYTIATLAREIGISNATLSTRLNNNPGSFTQDEMQVLVRVLKIENPSDIFFATE